MWSQRKSYLGKVTMLSSNFPAPKKSRGNAFSPVLWDFLHPHILTKSLDPAWCPTFSLHATVVMGALLQTDSLDCKEHTQAILRNWISIKIPMNMSRTTETSENQHRLGVRWSLFLCVSYSLSLRPAPFSSLYQLVSFPPLCITFLCFKDPAAS